MGDAGSDSGRRRAAIAGLILLATVVAYLPVFRAGFIWDDDGHVTPPALRSLAGLARIWTEPRAAQQYYPLLHTAFWVEHRLFGDAPLPYHGVNVLLHAGVAFLAWRVLAKLTVPGALFAALVFALHPVQVETVAWVSEQKNTLSALFALGALRVWLEFDTPGRRSRALWLLAFALFVCALLSKTVTATLPAALVVIAWWRDGRVDVRRTLLPLLPFFVVGAGLGLTTAWLEKNVGGAAGVLTGGQRLLLAGRAPWFYLGKLAWPANLCFVYPSFALDVHDLREWAYPIAALALLVALWMGRRRFGRGPLAAALLFGGTLFPVLGFVDVLPFAFSYVADHFQYLASLGLIALAAAGAVQVVNRWPVPGRALCLVWLAALAALTWKQSHLYGDRETLYRATIRGNPDCWMAHNNLAGVLIARGAASEAADSARAALRIRPEYPEAHNNLALALASLGRPDEAIPHYRKALELNPGYAEAHNNLGFALAGLGRIDAAIEEYRLSLRAEPDQAGTHFNLAMALAGKGDAKSAIAHLRKAVALQPDLAQAHNNLGILLARDGAHAEAVAEFRQALALQPDSREIRRNLDFALGGRRRP
jgi:tetratricopeptide (TPR) repeat protein